MTTWKLEHNDVIEWAKTYEGEKFHALFADPPYHLSSITKRFGKPGSAPAKGDVYRRASAGFMGSRWDGGDIAFQPATWAALSQHLYPGAFIMTFGGSRGYHRMATAMEDAGLIIHPALGWLTLSGFPKATQISSQIDKLQRREYVQAAIELGLTIPGNNLHDWTKAEHTPGDKWWEKFKSVLSGDQWQAIERKVIGKSQWSHQVGIPLPNTYNGERQHLDITAPATELARDWAGHRYGLQALKPAFEFIAVAQVPYEGRPVDSIVATGAGALNIDGGRIPTNGETPKGSGNPCPNGNADIMSRALGKDSPNITPEAGRWPANFVLTHHVSCNGDCHPDCPVRLFDEQAGERPAGGSTKQSDKPITKNVYGEKYTNDFDSYGDSGPASRMFHRSSWRYEVAEQLANAEPVRYEPKVSSAERDAGVEGLPEFSKDAQYGEGLNSATKIRTDRQRIEGVDRGKVRNNHPTLKPISLTKYLATLLLPPAAYAPRRILVPFSGVSSEMIGCVLAGWESVTGIESNAAYAEIARARLKWWSQWPGWGQTDVDAILAAVKVDDVGQMSLFGDAA